MGKNIVLFFDSRGRLRPAI